MDFIMRFSYIMYHHTMFLFLSTFILPKLNKKISAKKFLKMAHQIQNWGTLKNTFAHSL